MACKKYKEADTKASYWSLFDWIALVILSLWRAMQEFVLFLENLQESPELLTMELDKAWPIKKKVATILLQSMT